MHVNVFKVAVLGGKAVGLIGHLSQFDGGAGLLEWFPSCECCHCGRKWGFFCLERKKILLH